MEKLTIKVTLNPKNYFDRRLIEDLSGQENMAGALKALAYERLAIEGLVVQSIPTDPPTATGQAEINKTPEPAPVEDPEEAERRQRIAELDRGLDDKISRMIDKF